jgi:hypothetical protein
MTLFVVNDKQEIELYLLDINGKARVMCCSIEQYIENSLLFKYWQYLFIETSPLEKEEIHHWHYKEILNIFNELIDQNEIELISTYLKTFQKHI